MDERTDGLRDEGHSADQAVGNRLAEPEQPFREIAEEVNQPVSRITEAVSDPADGAAQR